MALNTTVTLTDGVKVQQVVVGGIAFPAYVISNGAGKPTAVAYNSGDVVFAHPITDGKVAAKGRELGADEALDMLVSRA